uniref:Centriolar coiled-coil protein of 110 kDa n=1 Tax=Anopheles minimus TaxID=112268 RepID=A0A182W134_9DIPT
MESHFVSVFKLDGVPILPPLVNEEVRAAVAIYRQKAIEIEKRLQERKRTLMINTNSSIAEEERSPLAKEDDAKCDLSDCKIELDAMANVPLIQANEESSNQSDQSTITVPSEVVSDPPQQTIESVGKVPIDQTDTDYNPIPDQKQSDAVMEQPCWQSPTRTVTPTSEESTGWFPLIRSNTYNLEKPSINLMNLHRADHSTPVDRAKEDLPIDELKDRTKPKTPTAETHPVTPQQEYKKIQRDNTPVKSKSIVLGKSKTDRLNKSPKDQIKPFIDPAKCRSKRKSASRKLSHSSAGSGAESERALESVAHALTIHERRMMELLKRQEEERLMLEQSFREKTQELVALCAKSLTVQDVVETGNDVSSLGMSACNRTKTPDINVASSVSQLSLCDVSYDSCTDTDDAAYQTCHANGTSEENVNNNEHTLTEDQPLADGHDPIVMMTSATVRTTGIMQDKNGNDVISVLPQRMTELQRTKAATIINAYARGYLTRRLFKTDEVQGIKGMIADIIRLIIRLQTQAKGVKEDINQAAVRRKSAGKQIALCLDRLHYIFVNSTLQERLHMIRRDRCLRSKIAYAAKNAQKGPLACP